MIIKHDKMSFEGDILRHGDRSLGTFPIPHLVLSVVGWVEGVSAPEHSARLVPIRTTGRGG